MDKKQWQERDKNNNRVLKSIETPMNRYYTGHERELTTTMTNIHYYYYYRCWYGP